MTKSAISGQTPHIGTGTESGYRYPLDRGKVVPVPIKWYWYPFTRKGLVPVSIRVVPVPMLPATLILVPLY